MNYYLLEKRIMREQEFFGLMLINMNKTFDKLSFNKTACVYLNGIDFALDINQKFYDAVAKLGEKQLMSIVLHEMYHIAFFHLLSYDDIFKEDKDLANIAADLSVNCYLPDFPSTVTVDGEELELVDFNKYKQAFNLEPYKDVKYYYDKLKQNASKAKSMGQAQNHGSMEGMSDQDKRLVQQQVKGVLERVVSDMKARNAGNIPQGITELLDFLNEIEPEKFNWRGYVRMFAAKATKFFMKTTRRKPSKRFPDSPGQIKKHYTKILNFFDQSGSMSQRETNEVLNEMFNLMKKHKCEVHYACFDTELYPVEKLKQGTEIKLTGGGGTIATPAIEYMMDHYKDYDCFLMFTDGYLDVPDELPKNFLLVLSSDTERTPDDFKCQTIKLEDDWSKN